MKAVRTRTSHCGRVALYTLKYEVYKYPCYLYVVDDVARYVSPPTINTIYNIAVYSIHPGNPLHIILALCMAYSTRDGGFANVFSVDLAIKGALITRWPIPTYYSSECNIHDLPEFFNTMTQVLIDTIPPP